MLFNASERKGMLILLFLITGIIIVPRQLLPREYSVFVLPVAPSLKEDTLPAKQHTPVLPATRKAVSSVVELNSADSLTLIKIRGIGPYYASKILRYRQRLGGFYAVKQLKDLKMTYFNVDSAASSFTVNPALITKRDLDTMSFKGILQHPYLEYEDVQMIFNAKRRYGHISYDVLEEKKVLATHKLKKIKPYFK